MECSKADVFERAVSPFFCVISNNGLTASTVRTICIDSRKCGCALIIPVQDLLFYRFIGDALPSPACAETHSRTYIVEIDAAGDQLPAKLLKDVF